MCESLDCAHLRSQQLADGRQFPLPLVLRVLCSRLRRSFQFWVPSILCGVTLVANVLYVYFAKRLLKNTVRALSGRDLALAEQRAKDPSAQATSYKTQLKFLSMSLWALPASFWLVMITQWGQAGVVRSWSTNNAEVSSYTPDLISPRV